MIRHITAGGTIIFACERSLLNALGHVSTSNQICFETVKLESLIRIISVMLEKRSYWCLCDWMGIHFSMKAVKVSAVEWDVQLSKSFWLYDVQYISHLCLPQLYCWLLYVKIFKMPMMWMMFPTTDRKAADPSQAGDQTDSKLKDSKERWVAHTDSSVSLQLVSWFFLFVFSLHLLLYSLSIIQNLSAKYNSLTRWLLSPIKRALSLTQWCTFVHADTDAHTHTHTHTLTHSMSDSLSLSSTPTRIHFVLLLYFPQLHGALRLPCVFFLLHAVCEQTAWCEVLWVVAKTRKVLYKYSPFTVCHIKVHRSVGEKQNRKWVNKKISKHRRKASLQSKSLVFAGAVHVHPRTVEVSADDCFTVTVWLHLACKKL